MNERRHSHPIWPAACAALTAALVLTAVQPAAAQPGWVLSHQKISNTEGGFTGTLDDGDLFGNSVASLGDLDGDGVGDLAVGVYLDDDGGDGRGAVWALFLNKKGRVKSHQKISDTEGGFTGILDVGDWFGFSVGVSGNMAVVGAYGNDDFGSSTGSAYVFGFNGSGWAQEQKLLASDGAAYDNFGYSVAISGDVAVVTALLDDTGGGNFGSAYVYRFNGNL